MGVANVPAASAAGLQPYYVKYTSSGTFTLPTGYGVSKPLLVNIQVVGGGGGGALITGTGGTLYAGWPGYFGDNYTTNYADAYSGASGEGRPGGSGGLCATQLYLTSNLSFTIGAAGARTSLSRTFTGSHAPHAASGTRNFSTGADATGGTGGTTTASVLQATGGSGGFMSGYITITNSNQRNISRSVGGGGIPAGQAGDASPLLGTLAGGSSSTTPIRGSFGVGGIHGDNATHTGADGTGGGGGSIGSAGAVILTYWA